MTIMIDNGTLCRRMEELAAEVFRITVSETAPALRRLPKKRRDWLSRLRTYHLVAAERELLRVSRKLTASLDAGDIEGVQDYVDNLSASRARCRKAGIAFDALMFMLSPAPGARP